MSKQSELVGLARTTNLDEVNAAYSAGALSNRNLIINGAMQVAQRGTSFSSGGPSYTVDRWEIYPGANPGVVDTSRVQFNASDDMLVVSGFNYYLNTVYSTGVGGAAYDNRHFRINQENAYFYAGKTFTISFWAKSDTNRKLGLETRLNAGATEDTLHKSVLDASGWQLSTSWQYFTHTFTIPALVTTSASIEASVASFYITADPVSTGATYDITGVQLEVGDQSTPFEHRSYGQELALCHRYYYQVSNDEVGGVSTRYGYGHAISTVIAKIVIPIYAQLRTKPTISYSSVPILSDATVGTIVTAIALEGGTSNSKTVCLSVNVAGGLTAFRPYFLEGGGGTPSVIKIDAEL